MFLQKVCVAFQKNKVPFALVGGYAVALHGAVRGTVDVDIIIRLRKDDFIGAASALKSLGLMPRLPITAEEAFEFRKEYIKKRNLIAWSFVNPNHPIEVIDIILTENLEDHKITYIRAAGLEIPVLEIHELMKMKKSSGRPQDLEDIRALEIIRKRKS